MKVDSVKRRYVVTLAVNVFNLIAGVINSTMVPKSLGPASFGDYQFLLRSFTSIRGFLGLSTSSAFFTYSSKNVKSAHAFYVFFCWLLLQLFLICGIVFVSCFTGINKYLFPGQLALYVWVIGLLEYTIYFALCLVQYGESKAESVFVQKISFVSILLKLMLTVLAYLFGILTVNTFILINFIGAFVVAYCISRYFLKDKKNAYFEKFDKNEAIKVIKYFMVFCAPLVLYEVFGFLSNYFDRWLLQIVSGSIQQGYFSLCFQWASVALIFSTSVLNIFWRETSFHHGAGDEERVKHIYVKSHKVLFYLSCTIGFAMAFQSGNVIKLFLSEKYYGAIDVLRIMAFYPLFFTIGQVNAIFFYATEQVKLYRNISIALMLISMGLTYVLVAPKSLLIPGFELASIGVAIKFIVSTFVCASVQTYFIARYLKLEFMELLMYQLSILSMMLVASGIAYILSICCVRSMRAQLILYSLLYGSMIVTAGYFKPSLMGLNKSEILIFRDKAKALIGLA